MKKKVISTLLAAITAISAVSSINAGAVPNDLFDEEKFSEYTRIEDYQWIHNDDNMLAMYMDYRNSFVTLYNVIPSNDTIIFWISDISVVSELENAVSDIDNDLKLYHSSKPNSESGLYYCSIQNPELYAKIDIETVKKIREAVSGNAVSFEYNFNQATYSTWHFNHMTGYLPFHFEDDNETKIMHEEIFKEYIESNNIDAEVVTYSKGDVDTRGERINSDTIHIVPNKELTPLEHFEFAKEIYEATGILPDGISPDIAIIPFGSTLDLTNYLNGDANCDQKYTIADSTAILQALGNPDKYGLSTQGLFNADSTGDGLTVEDAVAIKTALAKGIE